MLSKKPENHPVSSNGDVFSGQHGESDIFGNPDISLRNSISPQQIVSPSGFNSSPQKPVETYRKDGSHARHSNEESNVLKKLEAAKIWSLNTFKVTKQVIEEKLGTTVPTCDQQLDLRIQALRQMQSQYRLLLDKIRYLLTNLVKTVQCQRELAGQLATLGQQQLELSESFAHNAETQKSLAVNGEKLVCVLDTICNGLSTLVNQTFDDTMLTIRNMNMARIEYDANRKEADSLRATSNNNPNNLAHSRRVEQAVSRFNSSEENFFRLKAAVDAKLRLLHENRVRVMQHNLLLLQNASTAYSSGNVAMLDQTLKQFNVKLGCPPQPTGMLNKSSAQPERKRLSFRKNVTNTG